MMTYTTLPKNELRIRAVEGAPLSQGEVSAIESEETNRTGLGPVKVGPAATAQSIHDKQQAFFQKAGDLARKPVGEITREDAAEVQKAEVCSFVFREGTKRNDRYSLTQCILGLGDGRATWGWYHVVCCSVHC